MFGSTSTTREPEISPHLSDPIVADAIVDRILHNAHEVALNGPLRRKEEISAK